MLDRQGAKHIYLSGFCKISDFDVNNVLWNQFWISGLLETWITLNELYGAVLYLFLLFFFYSLTQVPSCSSCSGEYFVYYESWPDLASACGSVWLNIHYPLGLDRSCAAGCVDVRMSTGLILVVLQPPSLCSDSMEALCWDIRRYFSLWASGGDTAAPVKLRFNLLLDICWPPGITRRTGAPRCC